MWASIIELERLEQDVFTMIGIGTKLFATLRLALTTSDTNANYIARITNAIASCRALLSSCLCYSHWGYRCSSPTTPVKLAHILALTHSLTRIDVLH
jgi:hypothetical protein